MLIRADAGPRMGSGHLLRSLALACAWQSHGRVASFLSNCETDSERQRVRASGIWFRALKVAHPDASDLSTTLSQLQRLDSPWIVLDGYHFDPSYQNAIRAAGYKLMVIDDVGHWPQYHGHIVLNQNLGARKVPYNVDPDTRMLLGTSFVLLRPEFVAWQGWRRQIRHVALRVLVTMGGGDADNATLKVVAAVQQKRFTNVESVIVVGPHNPHLESLQQAVEGSRNNLKLMVSVADMPRLMAWADVAISNAGSTCWELAFMGLPGLLLVMAENQSANAAELDTAGAAVSLGWSTEVDEDIIGRALSDMLTDHERRAAISQRGRQLVDGRGCERVVSALTRVAREPVVQ